MGCNCTGCNCGANIDDSIEEGYVPLKLVELKLAEEEEDSKLENPEDPALD